MKKFNVIFVALLLSCFLLSFINSNNLNTPENSSRNVSESTDMILIPVINTPDVDTFSFEELNRFVTDQVINPIMDCFEKKDPHLFMTKCYSRIVFQLSSKEMNRTLYKNHDIKGSIIFVDCSIDKRIADVTLNYNAKTITVRESFRSANQDYKTYLSDLCKFIDKNGIPK
ncbi:hypothetical protein OAK19_02920 [Aureispira]|nr:hypothetical protein [Aureispira sp.]